MLYNPKGEIKHLKPRLTKPFKYNFYVRIIVVHRKLHMAIVSYILKCTDITVRMAVAAISQT